MSDTGPRPMDMLNRAKRKPILAIMGEFSAGKSTLCNLLIGASPLPVRVTATQLPPVWISHGHDAPYRETLNGEQVPIDIDRIDDVPLEETALVRIFLDADILELCDLIDMPGISDPNMSSDVWENVLHRADGVLWCTHATQAWRQTEAAVWKNVPAQVQANSLLLVTRFDKLLSERDRARVLKRVSRETDGAFAGMFPLSLTRALEAEYDQDLWLESGAEAFSQALLDLIQRLSRGDGLSSGPEKRVPNPAVRPADESPVSPIDADPAISAIAPRRVRPARVRPVNTTERPPRMRNA